MYSQPPQKLKRQKESHCKLTAKKCIKCAFCLLISLLFEQCCCCSHHATGCHFSLGFNMFSTTFRQLLSRLLYLCRIQQKQRFLILPFERHHFISSPFKLCGFYVCSCLCNLIAAVNNFSSSWLTLKQVSGPLPQPSHNTQCFVLLQQNPRYALEPFILNVETSSNSSNINLITSFNYNKIMVLKLNCLWVLSEMK